MIEHVERRWRPKDPAYAEQWQWNNDGSSGGKRFADVRAEAAWSSTRGKDARIAIIDFAFEIEHPDLKQAVGPGTGYFQRLPAGDAVFIAGLANYPQDMDGHGTFCAGMAAARASNKKGGCGIANRAELMLVACLDDAVGTQETLARAIAYAADPSNELASASAQGGAWVIACSLGPNDGKWTLKSLLKNALNFAITNARGGLGVPVFWAVANDPVPLQTDEVCCCPAVIAVGRSNWFDTADGSAYGPELAFLAPGAWVYSTTASATGQRYGRATGTSYAAPCAAGIAALVLDMDDTLKAHEVRKILEDTCDKIGGPKVHYDANGHNEEYGYGRVNAAEAIKQAAR
jgi:thermitase